MSGLWSAVNGRLPVLNSSEDDDDDDDDVTAQRAAGELLEVIS